MRTPLLLPPPSTVISKVFRSQTTSMLYSRKKSSFFVVFFWSCSFFPPHFHFCFLISKHPICCHLKSVLLVPFSYLFFSMFCFASQSLSGLLCSGRPHSFILKLQWVFFLLQKKKWLFHVIQTSTDDLISAEGNTAPLWQFVWNLTRHYHEKIILWNVQTIDMNCPSSIRYWFYCVFSKKRTQNIQLTFQDCFVLVPIK